MDDAAIDVCGVGGDGPFGAYVRGAATAWIKARAVAFTTSEAGSAFDDLAPLPEVVGDARIVAPGEPTHGKREASQTTRRFPGKGLRGPRSLLPDAEMGCQVSPGCATELAQRMGYGS